jgi:predicted ATP-grasp superfamily ATP-dependent carboligase
VEGRAMLTAIVNDISRIAGVEVATTWDTRLGRAPFRAAQVVVVRSRAEEAQTFDRLAATSDATLVIAPELGGDLAERCRRVELLGGRLLGPNSDAVALCADKLRLADHWKRAGVATIPTQRFDAQVRSGQGSEAVPYLPVPYPAVIKPRFGAGSQDMRFVKDHADLESGRPSAAAGTCNDLIIQPFIPGRACSVALLISPDGHNEEVLPPAAQLISEGGDFVYMGGSIPISGADAETLQHSALAACRAVPGLAGYVGVDLIIPERSPAEPIAVEINPRLTTSYLGYSALAVDNLAEWLFSAERFAHAVVWKSGSVKFSADGTIIQG